MDSFIRKTKSLKDNFELQLNEMDRFFHLIKQFSLHFDQHIQKLHLLIFSLLESTQEDDMLLREIDQSYARKYESEQLNEIKLNFSMLQQNEEHMLQHQQARRN